MKLEVGKTYKNRNGDLIILEGTTKLDSFGLPKDHPKFRPQYSLIDGYYSNGFGYIDDGTCLTSTAKNDLIEEVNSDGSSVSPIADRNGCGSYHLPDPTGKVMTTLGGIKNDSSKVPLELIPSEALFEIGAVLQAGKEKYGTANWAKGIELSRLLGAAMRHIAQFNAGEDCDEETKTLHIANAACNLMFAIWMFKNRPDLDDRWIKGVDKK